jgi:flagella basal body P-ring formation protein FlgA
VRRLFLLALAVAFAPVAVDAAPVVVRFMPEATIHGDDILLSDVAAVEGDGPLADRLRAVRIAPAPPPGATHALYPESVRGRLPAEAARVQIAGAVRVLVTRAFQLVRAADLVDAVRREAGPRLEAADARGEPAALMPIGRADDLRVATGALRLDARLHESAPGAPTVVATVTVRVNDRERHQVVLTFQLARLVNVVVAVRPLEPRRAIAADDLRRERRPAAEAPPDAVTEIGDPADLELLRPLQAGEMLTSRVVRPRIAVKRGDLVTLLLEGNGFRITTQGQASEDARRGGAVRVLNVASKREVVGLVEGGGVVRVPYRRLGADR